MTKSITGTKIVMIPNLALDAELQPSSLHVVHACLSLQLKVSFFTQPLCVLTSSLSERKKQKIN